DVAIFHAGGGTPNRGLKISTFSNTNSNAGVELDAQNVTGAFKFSTGGTERMRIDEDGKLLVGTTHNSLYNTSTQADAGVLIDGENDNLQIARWQSTPLFVNRMSNDGTIVDFRKDGSPVGSVSVSDTATAYNTSSDYRLKTDAQPMTGATERVQALNPVNFEWIADGSRVDGFLAHEAQEVIPEAVIGERDGMKDEEYEVTPEVLDDDGNVTTEAVMGIRSVPDYQAIDQSKLVPLLTAALQEALTEIASLKSRVEALEG
ncbi:MAG: tail fiber domain-containing protein, partial [Flavobacteriaceae bacterium]|nr:tail fiber domain-containing protein [Flavobacteriaceae bacterium]